MEYDGGIEDVGNVNVMDFDDELKMSILPL